LNNENGKLNEENELKDVKNSLVEEKCNMESELGFKLIQKK